MGSPRKTINIISICSKTRIVKLPPRKWEAIRRSWRNSRGGGEDGKGPEKKSGKRSLKKKFFFNAFFTINFMTPSTLFSKKKKPCLAHYNFYPFLSFLFRRLTELLFMKKLFCNFFPFLNSEEGRGSSQFVLNFPRFCLSVEGQNCDLKFIYLFIVF